MGFFFAFELVVDFFGSLSDQEKSAAQKDQTRMALF